MNALVGCQIAAVALIGAGADAQNPWVERACPWMKGESTFLLVGKAIAIGVVDQRVGSDPGRFADSIGVEVDKFPAIDLVAIIKTIAIRIGTVGASCIASFLIVVEPVAVGIRH